MKRIKSKLNRLLKLLVFILLIEGINEVGLPNDEFFNTPGNLIQILAIPCYFVNYFNNFYMFVRFINHMIHLCLDPESFEQVRMNVLKMRSIPV